MAQPKIGRIVIGAFFISLWLFAGVKPGGGAGHTTLPESERSTNSVGRDVPVAPQSASDGDCYADSGWRLSSTAASNHESVETESASQSPAVRSEVFALRDGLAAPDADEWADFAPVASTNTTRILTGDDFRRGFVMTRIGTNETHDFSAPSGAVVCADWEAFGADTA